jgi:hypothetical protein
MQDFKHSLEHIEKSLRFDPGFEESKNLKQLIEGL